MAALDKLTIKVALTVDERTAQAALKIVELYANQAGRDIARAIEADGQISLEYVQRRPPEEVTP